MKVLIACEESQVVCKAFRAKGHEAFSCDIQDCSGGHPEWHIKRDVLEVINEGWDIMIAFPPCTHLAVSGAAWFEEKRKDGRQQEGINFFMEFTKTNIPKVAIENPIGIMSKIYRKPDQIIHPYYFGDPEPKSTCLWLKNLPKLYHNKSVNLFDNEVTHVEPQYIYSEKSGKRFSKIHWGWGNDRAKERSKTFPGIAEAMSLQWG